MLSIGKLSIQRLKSYGSHNVWLCVPGVSGYFKHETVAVSAASGSSLKADNSDGGDKNE